MVFFIKGDIDDEVGGVARPQVDLGRDRLHPKRARVSPDYNIANLDGYNL